MNEWVEKSINLAKKSNYLDNLEMVYPINIVASSKFSNDYKIIKEAFQKHDRKELLNELLKFKRFPIDDPYIGFFRKDKTAISRNPKTVKRITDNLFGIGMSEIVAGVERQKSPSRQFGQLFRNYIKSLNYPVLSDPQKFLAIKVAFLDGGDKFLKNFAKKELGYKGEKGLDLILKIKDSFFVGETKFISTNGGTQDKSFREAMSFIKKSATKARYITILDGIVWLSDKKHTNIHSKLFKLKSNQIAVSALLLDEFIKSQLKKTAK